MSGSPEIPDELRGPSEREQELRSSRSASLGKRERSDAAERLIQVSAIGTEFAVAVVGGGVLGFGIDWLAGTKPWFLLGGCVFGLVWGFVRFVRTGLAMARGGGSPRADENGRAGSGGAR